LGKIVQYRPAMNPSVGCVSYLIYFWHDWFSRFYVYWIQAERPGVAHGENKLKIKNKKNI